MVENHTVTRRQFLDWSGTALIAAELAPLLGGEEKPRGLPHAKIESPEPRSLPTPIPQRQGFDMELTVAIYADDQLYQLNSVERRIHESSGGIIQADFCFHPMKWQPGEIQGLYVNQRPVRRETKDSLEYGAILLPRPELAKRFPAEVHIATPGGTHGYGYHSRILSNEQILENITHQLAVDPQLRKDLGSMPGATSKASVWFHANGVNYEVNGLHALTNNDRKLLSQRLYQATENAQTGLNIPYGMVHVAKPTK